jgi:hypothetical protein
MKQTNILKFAPRLAAILSFVLLFAACQKEMSVENGAFNGTAEGELIDSLGFCKNITVTGKYMVDTTLNASNYVTVNMNFTAPGKYKIYSDTVNGMWFLDSGFVVSAGQTAIKLKGKGTPILDKQTDFTVFFSNNLCSFSVTVTNSTGGSSGGGTNSNEYFPLTVGSNWTYDLVPDQSGSGGTTIDTFSVHVTPEQVQVPGGLTYSVFASRLKDTLFFAKDGSGDYYAYSSVDFDYLWLFEEYPSGAAGYISYPFLKPSAANGVFWYTPDYGKVKVRTSPTATETGTARAKLTVIDKNTAHTLHGKTYTDVIQMQREIFFKPDGTGTTERSLLKGYSYYAKGYGLIDQVLGAGPDLAMPVYKKPDIK